jgi:regulator of RNase E activity RraA
MTTAFKACGAVGVVTNGPSRDVDEIRPMKFQYLMSGVTPGHGDFAISAINVPVSVAGMDVIPGDIIHMDENGACKFPADKLADVCNNIDAFIKVEEERVKAMKAAKTIAEIKAAFSGKKIK